MKKGEECETSENNGKDEHAFGGKVTAAAPALSVPVELNLGDKNITRKRTWNTWRPASELGKGNCGNVKFETDTFEATQEFSKNEKTLATSDGSAANFVRTFGWAFKTARRKKLASNNGPAPGFRTSSFREEGCGLLSMTSFVHHTCICTQCECTN